MDKIIETGCVRCGDKMARCDKCRFNDSLKEIKELLKRILNEISNLQQSKI